MKKKPLSKQQWLIMEALWEQHPLFLSDLKEDLKGHGSWSHTTLLTHLKRLLEDGYVTFTTVRGSRSYSPAVTREECMTNESRQLMERMTESSAKLFVTNMIKEGSLTKEDRQELRDLIDRLEAEAKEGE